MHIRFWGVTSFLILLVLFSSAEATPKQTITNYLEAITNGDWQRAENCWDSSYIASTRRLGIQYRNVPCKYDCASPVLQNLDGLQSGKVASTIKDISYDNAIARITVELTAGNNTICCLYFARQVGPDWKLTSPFFAKYQNVYTRDTKYCRLFYTDKSKINSHACNMLDRFIETTCSSFGVTEERLSLLARQKIIYYIVSDDVIKKTVGAATKGMYDIPSDAIVSSLIPHYHELIHLLVNYATDRPSLYTLPFLQEGVACHFGGRWGRSPRIINYAGYINLQFGLADFPDILTQKGFTQKIGNADISYPISSLFVGHLIHHLGVETFFKLYHDCSGTQTYVDSLSAPLVKQKIAEYMNCSWGEVASGFFKYWKRFSHGGIYPFDSELPPDTAYIRIEDTIPISIWSVGDTYLFEVDLSHAPNGGILLLKQKEAVGDSDYESVLFSRQIAGRRYAGEQYGIRFTPAEVGVYNYYDNCLLANIIYGLNPEVDKTTPSSTSNIYRLRIKKSLLGTEDIASFGLKAIAL